MTARLYVETSTVRGGERPPINQASTHGKKMVLKTNTPFDLLEDNRGDMPRNRPVEPKYSWECWAEKRMYLRSVYARVTGAYTGCTKNHREGYLTCHWHQKHEVGARCLLKAAMEKSDADGYLRERLNKLVSLETE